MTKRENRCADCGAKFGLVVHHHGRLKFCRKACKDNFLAKLQRDRCCDRLRRSATFAQRHCWTCTRESKRPLSGRTFTGYGRDLAGVSLSV